MAKDKAATAEPEPEPPVGLRLIGLLQAATADDLAAVEGEIKAKETELAGLRGVQKLLQAALGVEPAKKAWGTNRKAKAAAVAPATNGQPHAAGRMPTAREERQKKCAKYILRNGITTGAALCRLFEIPTGSQTETLAHDWFTQTDGGYDLTPKGREAARQLA